MPTRRRLIALTPTLPLVGCAALRNQKMPSDRADLVLVNGDVHTVDQRDRHVSAVAISGNQVIATGSEDSLSPLLTTATRRIDLQGRTVLPGINDSHLHLLMWGLSKPPFSLEVTYPTVRSISDITDQVKQAAGSRPLGNWIVGRGWDEPYLAEGRAPTAADLDTVAPDHPVALTDFSGHAMWVNSKAMALVGIQADTVPPPGGVIVKNAQGQPTGLLFEGAAWMVRQKIPDPSEQEQRDAVQAAMQLMLQQGVTSCTIPGLSLPLLRLFNQLAGESFSEKLRVNAMLRAPDSVVGLEKLLPQYLQMESNAPLWLQLNAVKIMGDGIPTANKTAWLHQEYEGGGNGSLLLAGDTHADRVEELQNMINLIHSNGLQIGTHVTGDKSIDTTINAYQAAQQKNYRKDPRHYLIHADLVSEETLAAMAAGGFGANFNPEIKHLIADSQVHSIGSTRAAYEWPYRSAIDAGVITASSSDAPVTPGNWLQGIATCMDRKGKQSGKVSGPEQRISLDEAVRTYTWAGAWQDRAETFKGSLQPGMLADLCVVDERLSDAETSSIAGAKVCMTLVDGNLVHDTLT